MKKFSLMILLTAFAATTCGFSQNLRPAQNWLQAWKSFAGTQSSAVWLMEEVSEGATVYADPCANTLVVKIDADLHSMDEIVDALEAGIQSSNGNRMLASGEAEALDFNTAVNTWNGQLGGMNMHASVIAQLTQNGSSQMLVQLSRQPFPATKMVRNEAATALLEMLGSETAASPVVLGK